MYILKNNLFWSGYVSSISWNHQSLLLESIKTTSLENVSIGVVEKNKEQYERSKDKAEKWYDVSRHL